MRYGSFAWAGAALLALGNLNPAFADLVRLPPSVGATPIEIPYVDPDAPLVMRMPGVGNSSATPIEIPRINPDDPVAVLPLPLPLPGRGIEQIDPRRLPGAFSALPVPLPNPVAINREGRFSYAVLADKTIYGDTNFGYAHFGSLNDYQRFLRSH
ncbi:MAG: hypothetical protein LJE68_01865 [Rhodobacter sp.]|nr:hypothetical protein [Rhodobacter sp.]